MRLATELLPSPGLVLATMMTLGGEPGLDSRIEVRIPRSASAIFDHDETPRDTANSLNFPGSRCSESTAGIAAMSGN